MTDKLSRDVIQIELEGGTLTTRSWEDAELLFDAIRWVASGLSAFQESGTNSQDRYAYSDVSDIINPIRPLMKEAGLTYMMRIVDVQQEDEGKARRTFMISNHILARGAAMLSCRWVSEAVNYGMKDKGINAAATVAQKFFLKRAFLGVTREDIEDDPDKQGKPPKEEAQEKTPDWWETVNNWRGTFNEHYQLGFVMNDVLGALYPNTAPGDIKDDQKEIVRKLVAWYNERAVESAAKGRKYDLDEVLAYVKEKVSDTTAAGLSKRRQAMNDWFAE